MLWVRIIMLFIFCISVLFFVGNYSCYLLKLERNLAKIFSTGFIIILTIFHFISYTFALFHRTLKNMSAIYLYWMEIDKKNYIAKHTFASSVRDIYKYFLSACYQI